MTSYSKLLNDRLSRPLTVEMALAAAVVLPEATALAMAVALADACSSRRITAESLPCASMHRARRPRRVQVIVFMISVGGYWARNEQSMGSRGNGEATTRV